MAIKRSFPPIIRSDARILVLGSMPGEESLRKRQYYAHKQNKFWRFLCDAADLPFDIDYDEKIREMQKRRVALWDVLKQCERRGSLDSNIVKNSEEANDIAELLQDFKGITRIVFNGQKSFSAFKKHILKENSHLLEYDLVILPSTSPANASIKLDVQRESWLTNVWKYFDPGSRFK
ncbi:MAG: DNA-deoxyinosine glycosylase [Candidatus Rifleibacteriota bacterium]